MDRSPNRLGPWQGLSLMGFLVLLVSALISKPQTWAVFSPAPTSVPIRVTLQAAPLPTPSPRPWSENERLRLRNECFGDPNRYGDALVACVCLANTVERHFSPDEWVLAVTRYRLNREPLPAAFVDDYALACRRGLIP